jgi:hypothetical protein
VQPSPVHGSVHVGTMASQRCGMAEKSQQAEAKGAAASGSTISPITSENGIIMILKSLTNSLESPLFVRYDVHSPPTPYKDELNVILIPQMRVRNLLANEHVFARIREFFYKNVTLNY